uniref:Uncharacterized protein n=1 Tax=Triticum urartu TaxID=4572 RepID=A0A8R7QGM5_TRIUA
MWFLFLIAFVKMLDAPLKITISSPLHAVWSGILPFFACTEFGAVN